MLIQSSVEAALLKCPNVTVYSTVLTIKSKIPFSLIKNPILWRHLYFFKTEWQEINHYLLQFLTFLHLLHK